jgi:enoyl-CoA hydratase/carnithine racemase
VELSVATVQLPAALDTASVATLTDACCRALEGPAPVVSLTGASADTFCLGLAIGGSHDAVASTSAFADLLAMLHASPKPLAAVVDGRAIGGGMGLACACDWVVATDRATFALPELLWGLVPAIIWPVITDRMAPHVARQWTLTAHTRGAEEGRAAGLVDDIVAADELDRAVRRAVRTLRRLEPGALRAFRQWARESRQHDLGTALAAGATLTATRLQQAETRRRWDTFADGGSPWSS